MVYIVSQKFLTTLWFGIFGKNIFFTTILTTFYI